MVLVLWENTIFLVFLALFTIYKYIFFGIENNWPDSENFFELISYEKPKMKTKIKNIQIDDSISSFKSTPNSLSVISEEKSVPKCKKCQQTKTSPNESATLWITKMMKNNKNQLHIFNEKFQRKKDKLRSRFDDNVTSFIKQLNFMKSFPNEDNDYKYVHKILLKFLTNRQVNPTDFLMLTEFEKELLQEYIKKKKTYFKKDPQFYFKNPSQLKQLKNNKRVEENLKFIFRKLFKFLREIFNKTFKNTLIPYLLPRYRNSIRCDDYAFYGFLFEDSAIRLDTKIEKFFEPSIPKYETTNDQCSRLIRKTISKLYLKCIKRSDYFMVYLKKYVEEVLAQNVESNIKFKLNHIVSEWVNQKEDLKKLKAKNMVLKLKFSWTLMDIEIAIKHLFEYLGDISD